jgi:hypothetical protein
MQAKGELRVVVQAEDPSVRLFLEQETSTLLYQLREIGVEVKQFEIADFDSSSDSQTECGPEDGGEGASGDDRAGSSKLDPGLDQAAETAEQETFEEGRLHIIV